MFEEFYIMFLKIIIYKFRRFKSEWKSCVILNYNPVSFYTTLVREAGCWCKLSSWGGVTVTLSNLRAGTLRNVRRKYNFLQLGIKCKYGKICVHKTQSSWNPHSSTPESNRPRHDGPAACFIAQQYSSATFVSLLFPFHKEKFDATLNKIILFFTFSKLPKAEFAEF